jgi:hypothetical protein
LEIFSLCLLLCFIPLSNHSLFYGWGLDFIGQIHSPSSKGHWFVLVATDYFTKWTEIVPLKNITHREVIEFITEHIIHRASLKHWLQFKEHHLYPRKWESLPNYIRSNCSNYLHTMLKLMVRLSLVIKLWLS